MLRSKRNHFNSEYFKTLKVKAYIAEVHEMVF